MKYAYEDLSPEQFENLAVCLCQRLFGISVQGFSKGPDGGRDAKFTGTAEIFPSKTSPWIGKTIIQAKHTNGQNKLFSESDFFNPTGNSSVISKEIPRIKQLRDSRQLDHYMLFANRRLAANAESEIVKYISAQCAIPESSIALCGLERLELWLKNFPDVARMANLDPIDSPLIVSPDDLAEVVQALSREMAGLREGPSSPPTPRVPFERKNQINNMSASYAKWQCRSYLKETAQIHRFLAAPENRDLLLRYEAVVDEFQSKIIAKRKEYQTFDEVMNYLVDLLFARDPDLRNHKRLTRIMLFYMYWICDIGEDEDAEAN